MCNVFRFPVKARPQLSDFGTTQCCFRPGSWNKFFPPFFNFFLLLSLLKQFVLNNLYLTIMSSEIFSQLNLHLVPTDRFPPVIHLNGSEPLILTADHWGYGYRFVSTVTASVCQHNAVKVVARFDNRPKDFTTKLRIVCCRQVARWMWPPWPLLWAAACGYEEETGCSQCLESYHLCPSWGVDGWISIVVINCWHGCNEER